MVGCALPTESLPFFVIEGLYQGNFLDETVGTVPSLLSLGSQGGGTITGSWDEASDQNHTNTKMVSGTFDGTTFSGTLFVDWTSCPLLFTSTFTRTADTDGNTLSTLQGSYATKSCTPAASGSFNMHSSP